MAARAKLFATLADAPTPERLAELSSLADVLEVRADLVGDPDPAILRRHFRGRLLYTLRSRGQGGRASDDPARRRVRLLRAAADYDLVDLEAERDREARLLSEIPASRRVVSWHTPAGGLEQLQERWDEMRAVEAGLYKLVAEVADAAQGLAPLALLKSLGRDDLVAFAGGAAGVWTRLLAPRLGAPVVYAAAGPRPAAAGQPRLERLCRDYGLPELSPIERVFGIVGRPVEASLSPRLHNELYRRDGLPFLYLPFHAETFGDFWLDLAESGSFAVLGWELAGLSVTAPFKEIALAVSGASSPLAERIGSANTLVCRDGVWEAETTDPDGVVGPLRARGLAAAGRRAAVLGAGGAGRAAAFALGREGARVRLVNRSGDRGRRVARELGVDFTPWAEFDPAGVDVIVNATPLGRDPERPELPFEPDALGPEAVLVDLAYLEDRPTPLVRATRAAGRRAIDGREVLIHQAQRQYELMTGRRPDLATLREVVGLEAGA